MKILPVVKLFSSNSFYRSFEDYSELLSGVKCKKGKRISVSYMNLQLYLSIDLIKPKVYFNRMDIYSAVADSTRRNILELLATSGQLSAREISGRFQISPPAISQHLKVLRESRLVLMEKRAQQRLYQINPVSVNEFAVWVNHLGRKVDERFDRLDTLLESEKKKI